MLKANINAQIEAAQAKLTGVESDLEKIHKLIESTKVLRDRLLEQRADIIWHIEELKEELQDE